MHVFIKLYSTSLEFTSLQFVVAKAQGKVSEWLRQAEAFAKVIPSHDALLQKTLQILQGFNQLLPVLSKLSSPTLKPKHWRNISKGKISDITKTRKCQVSF